MHLTAIPFTSVRLCARKLIKSPLTDFDLNCACLMLTFLCWWTWEFWRFHQTRVFQTVPQPSIVSPESRCLDLRLQTVAVWVVAVCRTEYASLWFSPRSLQHHSMSKFFLHKLPVWCPVERVLFRINNMLKYVHGGPEKAHKFLHVIINFQARFLNQNVTVYRTI